MRISDWSSDVCSSDLLAQPVLGGGRGRAAHRDRDADALHPGRARARLERGEIGTHGEAARRIVRLIEGAYPFEHPELDRKSVVEGKSVSVRVDLGGRRIYKKKTTENMLKPHKK